MAAVPPVCDFGWKAPDFALPGTDGKTRSILDQAGPNGLVVVFICNHCPYVKHVAPELARLADEYSQQGIAVVGISSNDATAYPDDSPEMMKQEATTQGYHFPYLYDQTQAVAQAYKAACTPDFYLFNSELKLVYRGQLDDTRPQQGTPPNGKDLRAAMDALLQGQAIPEPQKPSIGCNIKWTDGAEPEYFNPAGSA